MHDDHVRTGGHLGIDKGSELFVVLVLIHPQPAFDRHRDRHGRSHRRHTLGHQRRLAHQAGTKTPGLHAVGRAAAVEVDLVIAPVGGDARGLGQQCRITAAQLQRQRLLDRVKTEQALAIAVDHRIGMHHLGIQTGTRRQQTVEEPAVAIGPVHHRRHGQAQRIGIGNARDIQGRFLQRSCTGVSAKPRRGYKIQAAQDKRCAFNPSPPEVRLSRLESGQGLEHNQPLVISFTERPAPLPASILAGSGRTRTCSPLHRQQLHV